jgi:large subunit ribosomal protein L18
MVSQVAQKNFKKRQERVRIALKKKAGDKLRLTIFVSNTHIYAQVVNDNESKTILSSSTVELKLKVANKDSAKSVGTDIAAKLKKEKITELVFDRGGYLYHGKVKALADAVREGGIKI